MPNEEKLFIQKVTETLNADTKAIIEKLKQSMKEVKIVSSMDLQATKEPKYFEKYYEDEKAVYWIAVY